MQAMATTAHPLTLSEQLDALLLGWLEHRAARGQPELGRAKAVLTIVDGSVAELERFCARWDMTVCAQRLGLWAVATVEGPSLPIQGLTEITGMYRR
jgi:hypothetical protein